MKLLRHLIDTVVWGSILAMVSRLPSRSVRPERVKRTWRKRLIEAGVLFAFLGMGGLLLVLTGLIPVKASSGHFAVTQWFLEFSMSRGFSTQSLGVKVPPLDDPGMILKGAGQFETTCRPCHGSPELKHPRVAAAMTPKPPYLPEVISRWEPAELFSIVKHGVKFTGMPAWPAKNRDDEVWAMVAFLQVLPQLDAAEYHRLAFGSSPPSSAAAPIEDLTGPENLMPRVVRERCARCHGADGRGRGTGAFPKLAGQHAAYLINALRAYEAGERHSGIMEPVAAALTATEMRELADFYAGLPPAVGTHGGGDEIASSIARGRELVHRGRPEQKLPACVDCHGPTEPHPKREYPMLAGQYADYLVLQLELFKKGHRGGSEYAHLMQEVAPRLSEEQMRDVALYYESLGQQ